MNMNLMKDFFGNLEVGPIKGNQFKLAMTGGIAIRKVGSDLTEQWIVYDKASKRVTNVGSLSFKASGMLWKIPVNSVVPGDLILHEGQPCYVLEASENGNQVTVYGVNENREFTFSPVQNIFNYQVLYTKVMNLMEGGNPFGAINTGQAQTNMPFNPMMVAMMDGDFSMKDMLKMQLLTGMTSGGGVNPMVLMMLEKMENGETGDMGSMSDMMSMMMMQNMGGGQMANPFANMFGHPQPTAQPTEETNE